MAYGSFDKHRFHPEGRQCTASRPHRSLKLGKEMLTPAVQAGLVSKQLTFRDIFTAVAGILLLVLIACQCCPCEDENPSLGPAASQQQMTEAPSDVRADSRSQCWLRSTPQRLLDPVQLRQYLVPWAAYGTGTQVASVLVQDTKRRLLPVHIQTDVQHGKPPSADMGATETTSVQRIPSVSDSEACYMVSVYGGSTA